MQLTPALAAGLVAVSAGGPGGLDVRLVESPSAIDHRRTATARYVLELTTGPSDERFGVFVEPPLFSDGGAPLQLVDGSLRLSGTAVDLGRQTTFAHAQCSPAFDTHHGAEVVREGLDVAMPARAKALLSADFRIWSRDAPFAGMKVRPTFTFTDRMFGPTGVTGTIGTDLAIRPPAPRLRGPTGVRLTVRTRPRTPLFNPRRAPRVEPGRAIRVFGTTDPVLRREVISLRVLAHGADRKPRRLARVRTDRRGRFRYVWRPRRAGIHELFVFYEPQRRGVTADRTCPRFLRVGRGR